MLVVKLAIICAAVGFTVKYFEWLIIVPSATATALPIWILYHIDHRQGRLVEIVKGFRFLMILPMMVFILGVAVKEWGEAG